MDIHEQWEKALKKTEVIRPRVQPLHTYDVTHLPYICLSESSINTGDTVVRRGEVLVQKPAIILPQNLPQFEGFDFEKNLNISEDFLKTFFLVRGVSFPSLKYNNITASLDLYEGRLSEAIDHYAKSLQQEENIHAGLIMGPEDCWQFSVLIFICTQIIKSADGDIRKLLEDLGRPDLLS